MALGGSRRPAWPSGTGRIVLARLFVFVGGLIVLALTAALVGPHFIDWTSYRADFEREASRVLGRQVTVAGEATARLLPFPSVTFTDVEVAGETGGEPSMTIETFSMDAELAPFMRGEILIFDMRLHRPVMAVDVADSGLIDWTIRPDTPFDPGRVTLENISVTEGEVTIRHAAGGRDYRIDGIRAAVSARTLAGPWRIQGNFNFDGLPMGVTVSTGTVGDDGSIRLRLTAAPADFPVEIETNGNVRISDGGAIYAGHFRVEAADAPGGDAGEKDSAFSISIEEEGEPTVPFRVTGRFSVDHRLIDISEFIFETGIVADPYIAEGTAFLDYGSDPKFSIRADGQQIRFDRAREASIHARPLSRRIAVFREIVQSLPRPGVDGAVNVSLPAIIAGDTTMRQVRLVASPDESGWEIQAFSAELPGRTTLEASGLLVSGGDFGFHGSLLLAVNQPSGFAAWLSNDVDEAIRRLSSAGISAEVDINGQRQTFRDLELILGGARFTGEIDHLTPDNAKPSMLMRLEGGALDVEGLAAFASIFVSEAGAARFAGHDLDFIIKAGPVSATGLTAGKVDTAIRLKDGLLDIDRLAISDLAGATVSATGKLKDFPANPTGNLDASIVSVDLKPLADLLAANYPENSLFTGLAARARAYPSLLADTRMDMVAGMASDDDGSLGLAISAHGQGGGGRFSVSASGGARDNRLDGPLSLTLTLNHQDAAALYAAYGLPALPLRLTGPAETSLTISGEIGGLFETNFLLRGDDGEAGFDGWTGLVDGEWQAAGKARMESKDIEPWLATAGVAFPGFGFGLPVNLEAMIDLEGGSLRIAELAGSIGENPVTADIVARISRGRPELAGSVSLPSADLSPLGAMLLGEVALGFDQNGRPGLEPFAPFAEFPVLASLELEAGELRFGLESPLDEARLKIDLTDDGIRISDLDAGFRGGQISGLAEVRNNGGTAMFSTQFRYDNAALSDLTRLPGIAGNGTIGVNLTAGGKSFAGLISSLSGSGGAILEKVSIPGVNPDVFARFINVADRIGKEINAGDVAGFAPGLVASGSFPAEDVEFTFVVADGALRTPAIVFEGDNARLAAELNADFNRWRASASGEISYDPGREALVGATPSVRFASSGPIGSMNATYDTAPLAQFLTRRALELEQFRVESLQAGLLEKQRLRREVRYYASLEKRRSDAEEARRKAEEAFPGRIGGGDVTTPDAGAVPDSESLEDAVRRILDEETRKRSDEDARMEDSGDQTGMESRIVKHADDRMIEVQLSETVFAQRLRAAGR